MKILICGSRDWTDVHPIYLAIAGCQKLAEAQGETLIVVHGDARGADRLGRDMARLLGVEPIAVPAEWNRYGNGAGPIRNQQMLDEHEITAAYAFRLDGKSTGTDDMCSRAKDAGIPVYVTRRA